MVVLTLNAILSFAGLSIMTRYLGAETFGSFSWAMALVVIFNTVADLGFNTAHIKRVSEGKDIGECISTFTLCKLSLTGLMVLFMTIFLLFTSSYRQLEGDGLLMVILFILYYVFYDVASIAIATFDARQETARTQTSNMIDPLLRLPLIVIFALGGMSAVSFVVAYVIGGFGLMVSSLYLLSREKIIWKRPRLVHHYVAFAIPYALVTVMATVSSNLDKLLLGVFWTNIEVGYYSASWSIVLMISVIGIAISSLVFPTFSKLHTENGNEQIQTLTWASERYTSMISIPLIAILVVFSEDIMALLFGTEFRGGGGSLRFLAIAMFLEIINVAYIAQIGAFNRPTAVAKLTIIQVVTGFAFFLVLVPTHIGGIDLLALGDTGAAIARIFGCAAIFFIARRLAFNLTGTRSNPRLLLHLVGALLTGLTLEAISGVWSITHWYDALLLLMVSYAVFTSLLFIFRELGKEDMRFMMSVMNPLDMWSYVKGELKGREPRS